MNTRSIAIAAVAIVGLLALAACGGGASESVSAPGAPPPAEPASAAGGEEGTVLAGVPHGADEFVGLPLDQAISWAEEQGRQWRVGREDGEDRPLTMDFILDRVTFTVEAGVVTAATIEAEDEQIAAPPNDGGN